MKHKPLFMIVAVITALALAGLACGGGAAATATPAPTKAPTAAPKPTEAPKPTTRPTEPAGIVAGEIAVVNQYLYVDQGGFIHVVGEIANGTEKPANAIELTIEVKDANGETLLKDGDNPADSVTSSPLLYTLDPGQSSPFDYYFYTENGEADTFNVTVTGQHTGETARGQLDVENAQVVNDGSGTLYFTGELVNNGDQPIRLHSLAGAMLDDNDNVVAANTAGAVTYYLDPTGTDSGTDRTPFRIRMDDPGDVATQWAAYWDADEVDPADSYDVTTETQNNYFDTYDGFHLAGVVTNNSDEVLSISLVAGLYAADDTVMDADTLFLFLGPGESLPYSFDYFYSVNTIQEQADALDHYTVQVDPDSTYPTSFEFVALETANGEGTHGGDQVWTFTGEVTNTSDKPLSSFTVVIGIYDGEALVATYWTSVYPEGDAMAPGGTLPYEVTVYLDPGVDGTQYQFQTYVQGYVR